MFDIKISKSESTRFNGVDWNNLRFGVYFSDHMFVSDYAGGSWGNDRIEPYGPMPVEPSMCTLHYGQTIFEGLKAFRSVSGGINIFRPQRNAERMIRSAERLVIPPFDADRMLNAMIELVKVDKKFMPKGRGNSLYLRPFSYGSGNFLGVQPSGEYRFIIITSPVGSYYPEGLNPVKILISSDYVRAVPGGTGMAKTAANYAASLLGGKKAKEKGFAQVLWLDGVKRTFLDEVGAMNIMFVIGDELITPSLEHGTILAGVTRETVLFLGREWGMKVSERDLSVDEVIDANEKGKLQECFGTGTAAVISPVGMLQYKERQILINNGKIGPVAQKFYDTITGIQYGEIEDKYGWNVHIDVELD